MGPGPGISPNRVLWGKHSDLTLKPTFHTVSDIQGLLAALQLFVPGHIIGNELIIAVIGKTDRICPSPVRIQVPLYFRLLKGKTLKILKFPPKSPTPVGDAMWRSGWHCLG